MIILALFWTVFSYLIFPIGYRCVNGKVSKQKGKKIALLNSIICALLCMFLGMIIGSDPSTGGTMFAPALFYYYIAKAILIDKNIEDENPEILKENNNTSNSQNALKSPWDIVEVKEDIPPVSESDQDECDFHLCPKCGMQVFDDQNYCPMCGEKVANHTEDTQLKKVDDNKKHKSNHIISYTNEEQEILRALDNWEPTFEDAIYHLNRLKEHSLDKFSYYAQMCKKDPQHFEDIAEILITSYSNNDKLFVVTTGPAIYLSETYLIVFTDKQFIPDNYKNKWNTLGTRDVLALFYELNATRSYNGIFFNPFNEMATIALTKDNLDSLHLDLLFDVPWKKNKS